MDVDRWVGDVTDRCAAMWLVAGRDGWTVTVVLLLIDMLKRS